MDSSEIIYLETVIIFFVSCGIFFNLGFLLGSQLYMIFIFKVLAEKIEHIDNHCYQIKGFSLWIRLLDIQV